jgi:hypothetical protein
MKRLEYQNCLLAKLWHEWKNNIDVGLKELTREVVDKWRVVVSILLNIDMDMSYTKVSHIKVAYRVPHKWLHAFYRPTFSLAVPKFAVWVSGVFAYVVASGDESWNY